MSLVLVAILVVIWASILVPLLRRERATWPGGRRPLAQVAPASARGGRAVWRPGPESLEAAEEAVRAVPLVAIDGGAGEDPAARPAGPAELGPVARWGRPAAPAAHPAPPGRRAMFRRRQILVALVMAVALASVPGLLAGGRWWMGEAAAALLLAGYLLALALLARRRHAAVRRPAHASTAGPAPAASAGPRLAAVPAAPE